MQSTFFEVSLLDAASGVPVPDLPVARLPASHLADFPALSSALAASLKPGDRVPGSVALFVRGAVSLQVTAKPALVRAAQAGRMQTSFKPEDVGGLFLGAIADQRQNYGLFVELPGRKRGLVPNKVKAVVSNEKSFRVLDTYQVKTLVILSDIVQYGQCSPDLSLVIRVVIQPF